MWKTPEFAISGPPLKPFGRQRHL